MFSAFQVALLLAAFFRFGYAVQNVEVQNQEFVNTITKERMMILGVDYQPGGQSGYDPGSGVDPLSNGTICLRDAALLQQLGVNTIRVYNVDPSLNHDQCASIFNAVGIYMIIDVNSPLSGESIDRSNPSGSYTTSYLTRIFGVVEAFKAYPNTVAFFAGNEVMNDVPSSKDNPPYIRAVQRDLKNYIAKHSSRTIPVGYSAADVRDILQDTWAYLQCSINGTNDVSRSDFFGLNSYSWCGGDATYQSSGYDQLVAMFQNSTIPVFFSEYGCNKPEGQARVFNEVQALYGAEMTALSGGLVYEYSQEDSDFGLVNVNDNTTVSLRQDYSNLQSQYNKLNISLIQSTNATATQLTPPACSSGLISDSGFSKNFSIPDPPSGADDLINNGIENPNNGKLVTVSSTSVPMAVYAVNGAQMQNVAIKPLPNDQSNTPSGQSASGSATTSAPSATATKKSGAGAVGISICGILIGGAVTILLVI